MTEENMPTLDLALSHAKSWLNGLDERPVAPSMTSAAIRRRLRTSIPKRGTPPTAVIEELTAATAGGHMGSASGRFFAWVIGGGLESALAADWLVSTWDQNGPLSVAGPAVAAVEEIAGDWLKELLDLPREASFAFTTGCQLAHFTSLAAARHALYDRLDWDVEARGLYGAPPIRIITNAERHDSVDRAIRFLGLGSQSIVHAATDDRGRMTADGLRSALRTTQGPSILVLNAADLNVGACDRFRELIPMAHAAGAWVHVDGAFGLFARASRARRHLLDGVELADSWATDAHKWLNVPFDCGVAVIRDAAAHRGTMSVSAAYLTSATDARDAMDWTPEWSRRARGVPVYAALRELGKEGVEDLVDRCCEHCAEIVARIGALPTARVVAKPTLNQGLLRFERADATDEANDRYTDAVIQAINETGEAFFSGTTRNGRRAMRVSVVNWRTCQADVDRTVAAAAAVLTETSP